ncbi:neuroendocrine secretory protein 55 [Peromyscus maniculatus bairdii]|uniref:neuroendocrine secretory protein 55 n=1 Tax=Peromyscus maniculatus bairdii TaxID=230844 RepID=UPI00042A9FDF|nr:neuroendocrine secretory protein 55 [Peromyscus maniculatus bairdii]XP_042132851.1 neuroendocrine secretory protein 55 [Peromyscus maniculatus bairdii]
MDRRSRAQQWRRARHNYNDLCPPIGRRAATALLWLSCSIALLRALATSNARAQQRAAQRRSFLNAHHRSAAAAAAAAQVLPESPESESDHEHEEPEPQLARQPECPGLEDIDYETESETESETTESETTESETTESETTESESDIESETEFESESDTAPATEPETEPEDERGPRGATFNQSLTQRLHALKLQSAHASPSRAQPTTQELESASEGEEPQREPLDPEESEEEDRQPRRCKTRRPARRRRDQSPESPPRKGPIPIRRH